MGSEIGSAGRLERISCRCSQAGDVSAVFLNGKPALIRALEPHLQEIRSGGPGNDS
jgi:hypothetical protein